jgi:hypothetical protein
MGQKGITSVVTCPVQKREVDVTYRKVGNWFNRKLDVLSCPAIKDSGGSCYRQCKSLLGRPPSWGGWYSHPS